MSVYPWDVISYKKIRNRILVYHNKHKNCLSFAAPALISNSSSNSKFHALSPNVPSRFCTNANNHAVIAGPVGFDKSSFIGVNCYCYYA